MASVPEMQQLHTNRPLINRRDGSVAPMAPASSPAPASKWLFSVVYVLFFSSFFFVFNPPPNFFVGGIHHCGLNASGLGKLA